MTGYTISRWLFLRGLGVVYLIAFLSLWRQVTALLGEKGLLPVADLDLRGAVPTVFRFGKSDRALHGACLAGTAASLLVVLDVAVAPALAVAWFVYLSFLLVGREFLSFQWDVLLVEAGFLAIVFAAIPAVSPTLLVLYWWLVFRLMFESGAVKLSCGEPTWRRLTALEYHYFTQPLPTPIAWYAHQLPRWFHKLSVALTLGIELGLPFLIFVSPLGRHVAFAGFTGLMVLIALTGNYNFFNLLTVVLSVPLVEDAVWARWIPASIAGAAVAPRLAWELVPAILAVLTLVISAPQLVRAVSPRFAGPRWIRRLERFLQPYFFVNAYGLFRVMTTERPEIIIEGSRDNATWKAYEFRYKPGDPRRPPPFCEPHQPRLDWQMWFAALGDLYSNGWLQSLLVALVEGNADVLRLLKTNPFPDEPPRYVRARRYRYEFTSPREKRETGAWWKRTLTGEYSPTFALR